MAIDRRCPKCGMPVGSADDTGGRETRCPECGAVVAVPPARAAAPEAIATFPSYEAGSLPVEAAARPEASLVRSQPAASENPFAAPLAQMTALPELVAPGGPNGPPWEREGPGVGSFANTVAFVYLEFRAFFDNMRREGGLWLPTLFLLVATTLGVAIGAAAQIAYEVLFARAGAIRPGANGPAAEIGIEMLLGMAVGIPLSILGLIAWAFVAAGVYHLMLLILNGAKLPFQATFRVVSYSAGAAALLLMVPTCGFFVANLVCFALIIIGLMRVQQISAAKVAAVVALPSFFCFGGLFLAVVALMTAVLSKAGH